MTAAFQRFKLAGVVAQGSLQVADLLTLKGAGSYRVGLRREAFFELFLADINLLGQLFSGPDLDAHASRIASFPDDFGNYGNYGNCGTKNFKKLLLFPFLPEGLSGSRF